MPIQNKKRGEPAPVVCLYIRGVYWESQEPNTDLKTMGAHASHPAWNQGDLACDLTYSDSEIKSMHADPQAKG